MMRLCNIFTALLSITLLDPVFSQEEKTNDWKLLQPKEAGTEHHASTQPMPIESRSDTSTKVYGKITIHTTEELNKLIDAYNNADKYLEGFRIQIFLGKPKEAQKVRAEFISAYPEVPVYDLWQSPNMKIRIGDLPTRLEAERLLREIRSDYPTAYIVKDKIELPVLKDIDQEPEVNN